MGIVDKLRGLWPRFGACWMFLTQVFGLDKRSMAVWRIAVGIVTIGDLINRGTEIHAHYSDGGVMLRSDNFVHQGNDYFFLFHAVNGSYYYQAFLFLLHAFFAALWTVGYRTSWTGFATWALLISLQAHAPFVGHGGDIYHRVVLFWSLFLPVGEVWSLDAVLKNWGKNKNKGTKAKKSKEKDFGFLSLASFGIISHVFFCYTVSAFHKTGNDWKTGDATFFSLHLEFFQMPMAVLLLQLPQWLLRILTLGTKYWEKFGFLCFVIPFKPHYFRLLGILGFWVMHLAFGTSLRIGLFFWITCANFFVYIPSFFWEHFLPYISERVDYKVYYNPNSGFSEGLGICCSLFLPKEVEICAMEVSNDQDSEQNRQIDWLSVVPRFEVHGGDVESGAPEKSLKNFNACLYCCQRAFLLRPLAWVLKKLPTSVTSWLEQVASVLTALSWKKTRSQKYSYIINKRKPASHLHERYKKSRSFVKVFVKALVQVFLVWVLYLTLCWNLTNIDVPGWEPPPSLYPLAWTFRIDQMWNMFSPNPPHGSFWYRIPGELLSGKKVELFDNAAFFTWIPNDGEKIEWNTFPADNYRNFKSHRWFKVWENGFNQSNEYIKLAVGRYICREYNSRYEGLDKLATFQIWLIQSEVKLDYSRKVVGRSMMWSHQCFENVKLMDEVILPPLGEI